MHLFVKALLAVAALCSIRGAGASCESLGSLSLPEARITSAQSVAAGDFTPSSAAQPIHNLPAFCRVAATLTPSPDSDIKIEVWMPGLGLEREVSGGGQRRLERRHQLRRLGKRRFAGLRFRLHRYRALRRQRGICLRPSGEADRLRLPLRA